MVDKNDSDSEVIKNLDYWCKIVFSNSELFESHFCYDNELIEVSWDYVSMKVVWMTEDGQHITDSFKMDKWLHFKNTVIINE